MAKYHGKLGSIKAVTTGGTPAAIGEVKSFTLNTAAAQVDADKIGSEWSESLAGLKSWEGSIECYYDWSDAAQADLVEGEQVDLELFAAGETSTYEKFTGTAWVTGVEISVQNDQVVSYNISYRGNGALTRGTVA